MARTANTEQTPSEERKTYTNWDTFSKGKFTPTSIVCDGHRPYHNPNLGCHTQLPMSATVLKNHIDADHGGGFEFQLKVGDEKGWSGWKDLEALGLECAEIRCGVCDNSVPLTVQSLNKHMKNHVNGNRRMQAGGLFLVTIGYTAPDLIEE